MRCAGSAHLFHRSTQPRHPLNFGAPGCVRNAWVDEAPAGRPGSLKKPQTTAPSLPSFSPGAFVPRYSVRLTHRNLLAPAPLQILELALQLSAGKRCAEIRILEDQEPGLKTGHQQVRRASEWDTALSISVGEISRWRDAMSSHPSPTFLPHESVHNLQSGSRKR